MLVSFTLENWKSFRDKNSLDMIASRERQHGERVPRLDRYRARVLPIATIFGGNASGKTNFFQALNFAKWLIIDGTKPDLPIPVDTFLLDDQVSESPSSFAFVILVNQILYEFSFTVTRKKVLSEKLVEITSTTERILYNRNGKDPEFDESLVEDGLLNFAFEGTRENQLFLNNSVSQGIERFKPIYKWFRDTLKLIAPDTRFTPFELFLDEEGPIYDHMNEALQRLDTGINRLGSEEVELDNISIPEEVKTKIREELNEKQTIRLTDRLSNQRFLVTLENGSLRAKKLVTFHSKVDGTEIKFDMQRESDGSKRVIDLLPAFLDLTEGEPKVYVIDEIDRSLHPLLVYRLLEEYLDSCNRETRTQLLLTTHSSELMDQFLLRRDEMWLMERDHLGASTLFSISEFDDAKKDRDISNSYLQGRMGGIPHISFGEILRSYNPV